MRIHHLNCGTMCPLAVPELVCHCLLLECSDRLVLVESGLGLDDIRSPNRRMGRFLTALTQPKLDDAQTAVAQVRAMGFAPEDVRDIVLTHLDVDHVGGISDFPGATVHVMRDEYVAGFDGLTASDRQRNKRLEWARSARFECHQPDGEPWFGFECVRALPGQRGDILLVPLAGHTRGHAGVAVRTSDRWLLHCGDAYFFHGEIQHPYRCPLALRAFQMGCFDNAKRKHSQARLRDLAREHAEEVSVFCAHDVREYAHFAGRQRREP